MASTYRDREQEQAVNGNADSGTSLARQIAGNVSVSRTGAGSAAPKTPTSKYGQMIDSAMKGAKAFTPTDSVTGAQQYLQDVIAQKPGSYQSKYTGQLDKLYNDIMQRGPMTYDMNGDALYQNYKDKYVNAGANAMRDTMGQATAQTGGYGNSYAQTAGQAAYNNYLQQLQQTIPQLQAQAQERYDRDTARMTDRYNLVRGAEETDYGRYRDTMGDWQSERAWAAQREGTEYDRAYQDYSTQQQMGMQMAGWERDDAAQAKQQAQSQVMTWIQAGVKPSKAMIEAAGMDYDQTMAYYKKVK